jgi:hypothetical protein
MDVVGRVKKDGVTGIMRRPADRHREPFFFFNSIGDYEQGV